MNIFSAKLIFAGLFVVFASAAFINAQTPTATPPSEEIEKVYTEEIKLNIFAADISGAFVADVKKEDLVINEDGRLHQANIIRRVPANVLILMDTGGEMRQVKGLQQTVAAAKAVIDALTPEDSVAIMQYSDKPELIAEWTNKEEAVKILSSKANFGRRSAFYQALQEAAAFMNKSALENRHLVLISDGTDTFNDSSEKQTALKSLLATDINVHVISYTRLERADIAPRAQGVSKTPPPKALPGEVAATMPNGIRDMNTAPRTLTINTDRAFLKKMNERKQELIDGEKYLSEIARDTNGEMFLPDSKQEMIDKTALVAKAIDSSYVITYTPKRPLNESPAGEMRDIEVTSRRSNLIVQAHRKIIITRDK